MNRIRKSLSILGLAILTLNPAWAVEHPSDKEERKGPPIGERPPMGHPSRETILIKQLLEMPPEKLSELRQTIERIEKMSPEEKERMRAKVETFNRMDSEKREQLRQRYSEIPKETRQQMRKRWIEMQPEEKRALFERMKDLSPSEQADLMESEGVLVPPQRKGPKNDKERDDKETATEE